MIFRRCTSWLTFNPLQTWWLCRAMQANKRVFNEQQKQQARVNASFGKLTMGSAHCMERLQVHKRTAHMNKNAEQPIPMPFHRTFTDGMDTSGKSPQTPAAENEHAQRMLVSRFTPAAATTVFSIRSLAFSDRFPKQASPSEPIPPAKATLPSWESWQR